MIKKIITGVTIKDQMDKAKEILETKVIPQSIKYDEKMKKEEKLSDEIIKEVTAYVNKNYKQYEDKKLYITESKGGTCFYVTDNKDASPLILSKGILR